MVLINLLPMYKNEGLGNLSRMVESHVPLKALTTLNIFHRCVSCITYRLMVFEWVAFGNKVLTYNSKIVYGQIMSQYCLCLMRKDWDSLDFCLNSKDWGIGFQGAG